MFGHEFSLQHKDDYIIFGKCINKAFLSLKNLKIKVVFPAFKDKEITSRSMREGWTTKK